MAKPIDVPVRIKLDQSISRQLNALAQRLQNIKISDNISEGVKKGASKASAQVSDLQKQIQKISKDKVDVSSFDQLQSKVRELQSTVSNLQTIMSGFVEIMSNASRASSFQSMINGLQQDMKSLSQETEKTVSAIKEINNATSGKADIRLVDKQELSESLSILNEVQDKLGKKATININPETKNVDNVISSYKKVASDASKIYSSILSELTSGNMNSINFDKLLQKYSGYALKAKAYANTLKKLYNTDVMTSSKGNVSEFASRFNQEFSNVQNIVRARILAVNDSISGSLMNGKTASKTGRLVIPIELSTNQGNLTKKVETILQGVQNSVRNKPIEVQIELASKTKSKTFNRALKKFQQNVDNLQDESARAQMQGLVDTLSKGYGTDITVSLRKSFDRVSDEIRGLISTLREQLTDKPLQIPDIVFSQDAINKARSQIDDISDQLKKSLQESLQKAATGTDKKDFTSSTIKSLNQALDKINSLSSVGGKISDALSPIENTLNGIIDGFSKLDSMDMGVSKVQALNNQLSNTVDMLNKISTSLNLQSAKQTAITNLQKADKQIQGNHILSNINDNQTINKNQNTSKSGLNGFIEDTNKATQSINKAVELSSNLHFNINDAFNVDPATSQNMRKVSDSLGTINTSALDKVESHLNSIYTTLGDITGILEKATGVASETKLDSIFNDINDKAKILDAIGTKYNTKQGQLIGNSMISRWKDYISKGGEKSISDLEGAKSLKTYMEKRIANQIKEPTPDKSQYEKIIRSIKDALSDTTVGNSLFTNLNNIVSQGTSEKIDGIKNSISELVNVLNSPISDTSIVKSIQNITNARDELNNLLTVIQASQSKIKNIQNATSALQNNGNKKPSNANIAKDLQNQLDSLYKNRQEYFKLYKQSLSGDFTESQQARLDQIRSQYESIKSTIDYLKTNLGQDTNSKQLVQDIMSQFNTRVSSDFESQLTDITGNIQKKINKALQTRSNQTNDFTYAYKQQLNEAQELVSRISSIKQRHADGIIYNDDQLEEIYRDLNRINNIISQIGNNKNIYATVGDVAKLYQKVSKDINDNSLTGKLSDRYGELQRTLSLVIQSSQEAKDGLTSITKVDFKNLTNEFQQMHGEMISTGQQGKNFFKQFSSAITSQSANFLAQYFSLQDFIRYGQQIAQNVTQVDSALVELQKVSDASNSRIQQSFKTSSNTAQELGATVSDVITDTADWSRLGYSIDDSEKMARATQLFQNVGDNMSRETASDTLISTMKAFNIDANDATSTISKYNQVA